MERPKGQTETSLPSTTLGHEFGRSRRIDQPGLVVTGRTTGDSGSMECPGYDNDMCDIGFREPVSDVGTHVFGILVLVLSAHCRLSC